MARAQAVAPSETEEVLAQAGDGMLLFVKRYVWEVLVMQARHERREPGEILDRALKDYLKRDAAPEVVDYLNTLAGKG